MSNPKRLVRVGRLAAAITGLVALGMGGIQLVGQLRSVKSDDGVAKLPRSIVRRVDLDVTLRAPGRVDSSESTLIECELEQLNARTSGGGLMRTSGVSTIIELIPEGSLVRTGDLICRFDSSEYEEMVRQQRIVVQAAGSDVQETRLDLEASEIALKEYVEGTRIQTYRNFERQITLAEGQRQRQRDCLAWAERLFPLGYISSARLEQERQLDQRAEIDLQRARDARSTYASYTEAKITRSLESVIVVRRSTLRYMENRRDHEEDQLAHHEDLVAKCSIRAPHDGMLIYANEDDDDARIELGARASYKMDLFFLPNLEKMVVKTDLNESVVQRVKPGMEVKVRAEALEGRIFRGKVIGVDSLPVEAGSWRRRDIRLYTAHVELDSPEELLPGMNAEVEILTDSEPAALVVPAEAVAIVDGRNFCYVTTADGVERRDVKYERGTIDLLRITEGLDEGEEVVLRPSMVKSEEVAVLESVIDPAAASDAEEPAGLANRSILALDGHSLGH